MTETATTRKSDRGLPLRLKFMQPRAPVAATPPPRR